MQDAAKFAGILESRDAGETRLSFLSEPEAAAVATMVDLTEKNNINVNSLAAPTYRSYAVSAADQITSQRGDTFVVVDCGGGTVDLISYEVAGTSPMTVRECAPGKGKYCCGLDDPMSKQLVTNLTCLQVPCVVPFLSTMPSPPF